MQNYIIADIKIHAATDRPYTFSKLKAFLSYDSGNPDIKVKIVGSDFIDKPDGQIILDDAFKWVRIAPDYKSTSVFMYGGAQNKILYKLDVNEDWSMAVITFLKPYYQESGSFMEPCGEILFRNRLIYHGGLVIHASAVEWANRGIVFTAPAGTGKTTHANLWKKFMGARILNGDRPALRVVKDTAYVYGTPWSGSSPEFLNRCSQLSAIIILEQAPENSIFQISGVQAVFKLLQRCFLPYFDSTLMDMAISNLEEIVKSTPVFLLKCKPDRDAVELVHQYLKREISCW